jgi:hypothetical protein
MGLVRSTHDFDMAITLEGYRALELTRPLTDLPTGSWSDAKRSTGALASQCVTEVLGYVPQPGSLGDTLALAVAGNPRDLSIYPTCGTTRGAAQHYRDATPTCQACLDARNAKNRAKKGRQRARRRNPGEPAPKDAA